jgi:hypothetical protein
MPKGFCCFGTSPDFLRKAFLRPLTTLLFLGILLQFAACGHHLPRVQVDSLPEYEALFQRSEGWTGGDGVFSVGLGSDRLIWLFGDTFIGEVKEGRHIQADLVNNTLALQTGKDPRPAAVDFYYRHAPDKKPEAFFLPPDGKGWFWPYHGVRTQEGLFLFLMQVERTPGPVGFDFRTLSSWLAVIENPDDLPGRWKIKMKIIPFSNPTRILGSAVLIYQDEVLIFGVMDKAAEGWVRKQMILVKAPLTSLGDFSSWRFFSQGKWITDIEQAEPVCDHAANEFSVSYQPVLKKFVLLYTRDSLSEHLVYRLADHPTGPWSDPVSFYRCPEVHWDPRIFCYAGKGHPELSLAPDELIVTYTTNSSDFNLIENDTRFYRPRFLRLRFRGP